MNSIIGKIFEDMQVIEYVRKTENHVKIYKVRCIKCGHEKEIQLAGLNSFAGTKHSNDIRYCGNYLSEYDSNIGMTVNDHTIVSFAKRAKGGYRYIAKCNICGQEFETYAHNFRRGYGTKHADCSRHIQRDKYYKRFRKIYDCMRYRTTSEKYTEYHLYGGRGISSEYYKDFMVFYNELYNSYKAHVDVYGEKDTSIDRVNPNGNYELSNVRWATCKEQANNTRKKRK